MYVLKVLNEGDSFKAPADIYHYAMPEKGIEGVRSKETARRTVEKFYRHYVLTVDDYGRHETFQYFDLYTILRGQSMKGGME